jgi:hypothetical protein
MKRPENALVLLPLLLAFGCASTPPTPGVPGAGFQIPDRGRPFADQPWQTTGFAQPQPPAPRDRGFEVPQRGIPFAEEQKPKVEAQPAKSPGLVYSDPRPGEAGRLPAVPRIVTDETVIQLLGFGLTAGEREKFDEARAQRIDKRVNRRTLQEIASTPMGPKDQLGCALTLPVCPLALSVGVGIAWVGERTMGRLNAAIQEPRLISQASGSRLAEMFKERATGASLQERVVRHARPGDWPAADDDAPRLVVRLTLVQLNYAGKRVSITIAGQAQATAPDGSEWPPTKHVYEASLRPLADWIADNDALLLQEVENALEALAGNIWTTYSPRLPLATPR